AFRLPDYLIPPRVLVWNPENLRGPLGLPFTLVFVDKRFIGIPAAYLTYERFEGCDECAANPPPPEPPRIEVAQQTKPLSPAPAPAALTASGAKKPGASPAPAAKPAAAGTATGSGLKPAVKPPAPGSS